MRMIRLAAVFALATVFSTPAAAQIVVGGEPMQMLPPGGRQMKTGTGRIRGRLLAADTGNPVRRAQVRLTGQDVFPKSATTDNEGRFEFKDLPAGAFTLNASKSGFVAVNLGQKRPFEPGKPIELAEGQSVDNADITMPKGSVISGRILDEFGEPVADTVVSAMRSTWSNGRRRLQATGRTAMTNDLGQYRIYGLPPGDYYVSATVRGTQEMVVTEMAAMAVRTAAPLRDGAPEGPSSGYAPTYFPGTPNGNEAQKIVLALGQEAQNTDFGLFPVRLVRIRGSVVTSEGRPAEGVMVSAAPRSEASTDPIFGSSSTARTDANGNFTLSGVAPGDYTLNARTSQMFTSADGNRTTFTMIRSSGPAGGGDGNQESGSIPLTVAGDDMSNVIIVTSKGASATGRVVYEGGSKPKTSSLRISAAAVDASGPMTLVSGSSSVTPEGTFELKGLSGERVFRVSNIPQGWVLKAVKVNGTDITDSGMEFKSAEAVSGVEVVLTTKVTEVKGAVKAGNDPVMDYTVVIFSDEPEKWRVPTSRHIATGRPNQQGQFVIKNLPPGSYYAIALEYIPQGEWHDPEVLERLRSKASTFTVTEGEVKTLDLNLEGM